MLGAIAPEDTTAVVLVLDAVQHIGNNSGSGSQLAGALAVEHNLTGRIAVDHDGVEYILNSGQRAFLVDEMRCNISVSGAVLAADRAAQQLDNAAQLVGVCYVLEGDLSDALAGNLIRIELIAVSKVGQNADLAAGVVTLDVSGRVLLA